MKKMSLLAAQAVAYFLLLPFFAWFLIPLPDFSRFTAVSQLLSFLPGYSGILLRRVWYRHTLRRCGTHLTVDWLGVIRTRESEIGDRCTLGVANWAGWVKIGNDVMTGNHVVLLSGARQHAFDDLSTAIRAQHGFKEQLEIGDDVWIGAQAVIMASVSSGNVVGAGSVVTKTFDSGSVIAGNPARLIRMRGGPAA